MPGSNEIGETDHAASKTRARGEMGKCESNCWLFCYRF
jgi:hypothetical protein